MKKLGRKDKKMQDIPESVFIEAREHWREKVSNPIFLVAPSKARQCSFCMFAGYIYCDDIQCEKFCPAWGFWSGVNGRCDDGGGEWKTWERRRCSGVDTASCLEAAKQILAIIDKVYDRWMIEAYEI